MCSFSLHVPLHVERQVVGAREGPLAQVTLERPVARVLPEMTREFVGSGELPAAAVPVAMIRFFSYGAKKKKKHI